MALGLIQQFYDGDWDGSEKAYQQAIALNPGYAEAHHELSMLFMRRRRFDDALREAQRALYLAPTSARFLDGMGQVQAYSGRLDGTLATADRLLAIDSTNPGAYALRARVFAQRRRYDDAVTAWSTCARISPSGCPRARAQIGYLYAVMGRRWDALRVVDTLKTLLREPNGNAQISLLGVDIATIYAGLGEPNEALAWLERAGEGDRKTLNVAIDPALASLQTDSRFQALLKKVGLGT